MKLLTRPGSAAPDDEPRELPERPLLAEDVLVHEPAEDGAPWIVQRAGNRYLRVGAGMARLLRSVDGEHTQADLAAELGAPWTEQLVGQGLQRAEQMELLHDENRAAVKTRRFAFVPPLTFQFTVLAPDRFLDRLRPVLGRLARRPWAVAVRTVIAAGILCLLVQGAALHQALGRPIPLVAVLAVLGGTWAGSALHEMSHGAVLSHYGGRPSRMGLMLFYLTPGCFCDVSDGWRLPRREQRMRVALAGVATQAVLGSAAAIGAALAAVLHGPALLRVVLLVFAATNYLAGAFNLVPFVKLDGYLALMAKVDVSHLRDRSMADARRLIARILFGGRWERELADLSWSTWFGLACLTFPLYILATAFTLWQSLLEGMGLLGAVLASLALTYLSVRCYLGAARLIGHARDAGARLWRIVTVSALVVAAAVAALGLVKVPYTVSGGFVRQGDQVVFVTLGSADRDAVQPGMAVRFQHSGILLHSPDGQGVVAPGAPRATTAPVSAFAPLQGLDRIRMPAFGRPLSVSALPTGTTGPAEVTIGHRSLGDWLFQRYFAPFWR